MKFELKNKKAVSVLLLGFSGLMGLMVVVKAGSVLAGCLSAKGVIERAVEKDEPDPNAVERYFAGPKGIAEELKKKNLFSPPEPNNKSIKEVMGILGNEALIGGKWYKVGDKIGEAEILAIEATQIRYRWEGKELTAAPIEASSPGNSGRDRRDRDPAGEGRPAARARPGREGGSMRGMGFFGNLSEQERREMRERFRNASDEDRERMRVEMRERFGGRRRQQ